MVDELGISIVIAGSNLVAEYIPVADTVLQVSQSLVIGYYGIGEGVGYSSSFSGTEYAAIAFVESVALDYAEFD